MAIDYGERRVGLAVSDPTGTIASPAGFIERRRGKRPPIAEMIRRGAELEVEGYVVGLPLDGNGDDTPRATEARRVAAEIEKRTGLPVRLVDERYTTAAALRAVLATVPRGLVLFGHLHVRQRCTLRTRSGTSSSAC